MRIEHVLRNSTEKIRAENTQFHCATKLIRQPPPAGVFFNTPEGVDWEDIVLDLWNVNSEGCSSVTCFNDGNTAAICVASRVEISQKDGASRAVGAHKCTDLLRRDPYGSEVSERLFSIIIFGDSDLGLGVRSKSCYLHLSIV